ACGRLFLQSIEVPKFFEAFYGLLDQVVRYVQMPESFGKNRTQQFTTGKRDVMEDASAQKRVWKLTFPVARNDHDWTSRSAVLQSNFGDNEFHLIEHVQQVIGKVSRRLVDLVDQHDAEIVTAKDCSQNAVLEVVGSVLRFGVVDLCIVEA